MTEGVIVALISAPAALLLAVAALATAIQQKRTIADTLAYYQIAQSSWEAERRFLRAQIADLERRVRQLVALLHRHGVHIEEVERRQDDGGDSTPSNLS